MAKTKTKKKEKKASAPVILVEWKKALVLISSCYGEIVDTTMGNQKARIRLRKAMQELKAKSDSIRGLAQEYSK